MTVHIHDFKDQIWKLSRSYLSAGSWEGVNSTHRKSCYRSPHGIVEIYEYRSCKPSVSMRFIHEGNEHMRRWETRWGDKTLARLAREFVEEVVA